MSRQLPNERPNERMETFLRDTASGLSYPPTPDIAGAVWQRLVKQGGRTTTYRRRGIGRRLGGVALSVALMMAVVLAVPEGRSLVGSIVRTGMNSFVVATSTSTPTPTSTRIPTATPQYKPPSTPGSGPTSQLLSRMEGSMSLDEARGKVPFTIQLPSYPSNLGGPDRVFVQDLDGPTLILLWIWPGAEEKVPVVLYEMPDNGKGIKTKDDYAYMQAASVNHHDGQWVRGPYVLDSGSGQGLTYTVVQRLVGGNMLAWSENGVAYRLESTYSLPDAQHVAESLRSSP